MLGPVYYTTNQVAKVLGVSNQTVANWVDDGLLRAHRTPGGHRRIARADMVAFARAKEYPLTGLVEHHNGAHRKKVLIVDDEQDWANTVREYLVAKAAVEVEVADSGYEAGKSVARFKPDLILMDLMMPDMDGFEVHRSLRDDPETCHVPVIACTGYRDPDIDRRIVEERFDGFYEKPLKLDALLDLIRGQLHLDRPEPAEATESRRS